MANVTRQEDANASDFKVDDLIKVNVISRAAKEDLNVEHMDIGKVPSEAVTKTVNFTKIAPKPSISSIKTTNSGQVVIIQGPSGTPVPIRVAGTYSSSSNTKSKQPPVTIQVLRMADGSLLKINNKVNISNITQLNISGKKTINTTSVPGERILVKNSSSSQTVIGTGTKGSQILKPVSVSEAQKIGFIKAKASDTSAKQLQKILPLSSGNSTALAATTTTTTSTQKKVLLPDSKEIIIEGNAKPLLMPQHILKLSPNSSGPIQAIQIPGKPGFQYVRVLGTTGASATTSKIISSLTTIKSKESSPTKITTSQIVGNQKIILNTKTKQAISFGGGNKDGISGPQMKANKSLITTVPTLRKIQDGNAKFITVVKNEDEDTSVSKIKSISQSKLSQKNPTKESIHNRHLQSTDSSLNSTINISGLTSPKKLFNVLKPISESEDNSYIPRKRSPSPDALRRKHCNCTKSQCLKLYCDCFANGEFCQDCNCKECFNNLEYEDERQKAIKICLERNPNAFKPKITKARDQSDLRLHNKGCNCKRSGCLKNYCECYEAKIACSSNCKCFGCRNVEDRSELDPFDVAKIAQNFGRGVAPKRPYEELAERPSTSSAHQAPPSKQPYNFITQDVVDATIQCMIAQADECKKSGMQQKIAERMIIEELGRCLVEIIDFSIRNMEN